MGNDQAPDESLRHVDASRRAFLKKLILSSAFVIPAVASFSMTGLGAEKAQALGTRGFPLGTPGAENCYGQTIAFIEHIDEVVFEELLQALTSVLTPLGLEPAHGIASLAEQWCRYGGAARR